MQYDYKSGFTLCPQCEENESLPSGMLQGKRRIRTNLDLHGVRRFEGLLMPIKTKWY